MTGHNPRSSSEAVARETRKGFSLIEAAIVLAVVGLVIGGIWTAASALSYHFNEQKFLQGFLTQKINVEKYLTQTTTCTGTMNGGTGGEFVGNKYPALYALLIPNEWKQIKTDSFCGWGCGVTTIACNADGVRYYAIFFRSQGTSEQCKRYFDYMIAHNILVGSGGVMGNNNCNTTNNFYRGFNVFYEIPRRS